MIYTVTPNPVLDRTLFVPAIELNTVTRAHSVRLDWGGKGFNVSRVLAALGCASTALGFIGGATGRRLAEGLAELGIATGFTPIAGETRTNIVIAESDSPRHIKVNEAGPQVTPAEVGAFLAQARALASPGDLWVLAGSLPPGAPANFFAQVIEIVQEAGGRAVLDASGAALAAGCAAAPYLVKPNREEAAEAVGHPLHGRQEIVQAARWFLGQGVGLAAISLGADGLLLAGPEQAVWARPPAIEARSAVGVGDALVAGMVMALGRGAGLAETARWGVAAGAAAAQRAGVAALTPDEVAALYTEVQVAGTEGAPG